MFLLCIKSVEGKTNKKLIGMLNISDSGCLIDGESDGYNSEKNAYECYHCGKVTEFFL